MSVEKWIRDNVPQKETLSRDAVEILIKLAWEAASKAQKKSMSDWTPPKEIIGPYEIDCLDYSPKKKTYDDDEY